MSKKEFTALDIFFLSFKNTLNNKIQIKVMPEAFRKFLNFFFKFFVNVVSSDLQCKAGDAQFNDTLKSKN